jgi:hypothetical protein
LAQLGYIHINIDEGWFKGRSPNGTAHQTLHARCFCIVSKVQFAHVLIGVPNFAIARVCPLRAGGLTLPVAGTMVEDFEKFPSGMKAMGDFIKSQEIAPGTGHKMHYGLYSCRGTCQCGTSTYHAPGSNGHEKDDASVLSSVA